MVAVVCAGTRDYTGPWDKLMLDKVDVCGPCCQQISRESPWLVLRLPVKSKEASFALLLMTTDSELRKRDIEGFCNNLYPCNSLNRNHQREQLKTVIKMGKCSSPQLRDSGGSTGRGGLYFL